jgi:hypothetical protein
MWEKGAAALCTLIIPRPSPNHHLALLLRSPAEYDEGGKYALAIEDAHRTGSSAAMELLRRGENLAAGLAVLKRYFLTAQVSCWE